MYKFKTILPELHYEIKNAESILNLQENWDDDGALSIPKNIFDNAIQFLKSYALKIFKEYQIKIAVPSINPVKDGTIDIEWHTENARFLINFKNDNTASYYGDNNNNLNSIKGKVSVLGIEDYLAAWMTKLKE